MKFVVVVSALCLVACGDTIINPASPAPVILPPSILVTVVLPDGHVCDRTCPPSHPQPKPPTPAVPDRCVGKAGEDFKARDHVQWQNECGPDDRHEPKPPVPPTKPVPPSCLLTLGTGKGC